MLRTLAHTMCMKIRRSKYVIKHSLIDQRVNHYRCLQSLFADTMMNMIALIVWLVFFVKYKIALFALVSQLSSSTYRHFDSISLFMLVFRTFVCIRFSACRTRLTLQLKNQLKIVRNYLKNDNILQKNNIIPQLRSDLSLVQLLTDRNVVCKCHRHRVHTPCIGCQILMLHNLVHHNSICRLKVYL